MNGRGISRETSFKIRFYFLPRDQCKLITINRVYNYDKLCCVSEIRILVENVTKNKLGEHNF